MNYTSIEQSKKLLELGMSPESADMYYMGPGDIDSGEYTISENTAIVEIGNGYKYRGTLPCWSLGALLDVIKKAGWDYKIDYCSAILSIAMEVKCRDTTNVERDASLLEVVYKSVVWLLENNYLNK